MLIEKITVTAANLNAATNQNIVLTDYVISDSYGNKRQYRPFIIRGVNNTGALVSLLPLTDEEYTAWNINNLISGFLEFANNAIIEIPVERGEITHLIVKGTSGSHSADLNVFSVRE